MKKLTDNTFLKIAIMAVAVSFVAAYMVSPANADPRLEKDLCHFPYDVNNADNEIKSHSCKNEVNPYDSGDGQGELGYGSGSMETTYRLPEGVYPKVTDVKLKGTDATNLYQDHQVLNSECVMVTSNYNSNTGTYNITEYRTRDWNLELASFDYTSDRTFKVKYNLACRKGIAQ